eukprot:TRINITY_DN2841_c0_g1_i4.p1 TRINITY_DN2841_c0_g1~~TRINITY_DN2841_c0_g1_i4.p1  ORF type:complete len:607 (-),score=146.50 TRINITY_DN2841_c0_g1_i4:112-1932(-)
MRRVSGVPTGMEYLLVWHWDDDFHHEFCADRDKAQVTYDNIHPGASRVLWEIKASRAISSWFCNEDWEERINNKKSELLGVDSNEESRADADTDAGGDRDIVYHRHRRPIPPREIIRNYLVVWHWDGRFQHRFAETEANANLIYGTIVGAASRVLLEVATGRQIAQWAADFDWEMRVLEHARSVLSSMAPKKYIAVWHWDGDFHSKQDDSLATIMDTYNGLDSGASRLVMDTENQNLVTSWFYDETWEESVRAHCATIVGRVTLPVIPSSPASPASPGSNMGGNMESRQYVVVWHWDDSYHSEFTRTCDEALAIYNRIDRGASRLVFEIATENVITSWFGNAEWENNVRRHCAFVVNNMPESAPSPGEGSSPAVVERDPRQYLVVWHWDDSYHSEFTETFDEALEIYNIINRGASRLVFEIATKNELTSWFGNAEWEDNVRRHCTFVLDNMLAARGPRYLAVWHWDDSFQSATATSEPEALAIYNDINRGASRVLVDTHDNRELASWFYDLEWEGRIRAHVAFVRNPNSTPKYLVAWHWDERFQSAFAANLQDARRIYHRINAGATRLLFDLESRQDVESWFYNYEWQQNLRQHVQSVSGYMAYMA